MPILPRAAVLALIVLMPLKAEAEHPGSRAIRESATRVRIEAAALAADNCTRFEAIRPGAPAVAKTRSGAGSGAVPVTARLRRGPGTCRSGTKAVRGAAVLNLPVGTQQILIFLVGPDGALLGREQVPVR
jgi:hypothetical protein